MTGLYGLALVTEAFGGRGGIAQYNRDFLEAVVECGLLARITVVARQAPHAVFTPDGIVETAPRGKLGYALKATFAAAFRPADLIFCGHLHLAPLAAAIARLLGAKLLVQTHGIEAWSRPSLLQRAAVEAADLVLSVSRHTRAAVLGWARIAPERVVVLPNTIGETFAPGDGSALRNALGLQGKRVLLTVGRIDARERYKGHDRVIAAIPDLLGRGHDVVYAVVGEGDDRARLEERARQKGIGDHVRFLGALALPDLALAYRMADLFLMPSTGEGFGIAFLEAMASGLPALGLAVGGARDALVEGELGTLVAEEDLPSAIARLLEKPRTDPYALAARTRARFGREPFRAQLRDLFHRFFQAA